MEGIANNKCKWLDRSNALDLLRCQAAIVIGKSENGLSYYLEFYWQSELICTTNHSSWLLLAEQTNLYKLKKKYFFY